MKYLFAVVTLLISIQSHADTVVYHCKERGGIDSFQDTPCPLEAIRVDASLQHLWNEMNLMVKDGERVNSTLGADIYSIRNCLQESQAYQQRLSSILVSLSRMNLEAQAFDSAIEDLKECGECSVSATHYCQKASFKLLKEISLLSQI